MKKIFFKSPKNPSIAILVIFSFLVNFYFGSQGVLPVDTFSHFDSTYKLLNGVVEFRDFWNVSGAIIDYIQLPFFYFFGANWTSYILQSSIFNSFITICTYFFFKNLGLKNLASTFYSLSFSILANPSMGTAFVDHYSTFFSLIALYCFFFGIKKEKSIYWFLLPILLFFAFLSKQTPSSYVILLIIFMTTIYFFTFKKVYFLKPLILGSVFCISFLAIFLIVNNIRFLDFFIQYFLFPQTIGSSRFESYDLNFFNTILNFKFIYILLLPLIYLSLSNFKHTIRENKKMLIINLTLILFVALLIFHQIYTKNFIYIFFLIPLIAGSIHLQISNQFTKNNLLIIFIIFFTIFTSFKYHLRFNVERKMLNLENVDLTKAIDAKKIDNKLSGLKWVTYGSLSPAEEINLIKESLKIIDEDKRQIMLITHYNFFSTVLEKNLYAPSRWPADAVSNPSKENKYYENYIEFTKNLIKRKNIKSIYIMMPSAQKDLSNIFPDKCIIKNKKNKILFHFELTEKCY
jgi:hypothetical protein